MTDLSIVLIIAVCALVFGGYLVLCDRVAR
jgi:hypothetical protein